MSSTIPLRKALAVSALLMAVSLLGVGGVSALVHLEPGMRAVVFGTHNSGLLVREKPSRQSPVLTVVSEGTEVDVVDGPVWASSIPWYRISGYREGAGQGWSSGNYLQPQQEAVPEPQESAEQEAAPEPQESAEQEAAPEPQESAEQDRSPSARGAKNDERSFVALVTAYCIHGTTRSGTGTRWGVVAVDPTVVPLGSRILIEGFDEVFLAEDTGGGVKGNWVDIWFPTYDEARRFGVQARRVTIVEP